MRKQLKICERIENKVPRLRVLIEQEKQLEQGRYKYKYPFVFNIVLPQHPASKR